MDNTKSILLNQIKELEHELLGVKAALKAFEEFTNNKPATSESIKYTSSLNNSIPEEGTWLEQIVFILKDRNRFLHNNELAEALKPLYLDKTVLQVKRRISSVLSSALKKNLVPGLANYRFSNSIKDTVWGKKDWFKEDGTIKKEHLFISEKYNVSQNKIEF